MVAGFKLRVNGGAYTDTIIDVGMVYAYLLEGLEGSTEYAVEIASYDEDDVMSDWSVAVLATTDASPSLSMIIDEDGNAFIDEDGNAITILI